MIVVNLYCEEDYNAETDGFHLVLAGIINDTLDLYSDPLLIQDCIENDEDFEPKAGCFYEIQLLRATIASDPVPESAFSIFNIHEKFRSEETGDFETPLVRM